MANTKNTKVDDQLVASKEFPNIMVDNVMLKEFDGAMKELKASDNANVKVFVEKIQGLKGYSIHDGSSYHGNSVNPDGSKNKDCSGLHAGDSREINIPMSFFKNHGGSGEFYGKEGKNGDVKLYDVTFAGAIVHELAHATKMDSKESPMTNGILDRLKALDKQIAEDIRAGGHKYGQHTFMVMQRDGKIDSRLGSHSKKEVGAVAVENYVMNHVTFNGVQSHIQRLNFGDQGERFTSKNVHDWLKNSTNGYQMQGECKNHTPLQLERSSDNQKTSQIELSPDQKISVVGEQLAALKPEQQAKLEPAHKEILEAHQAAASQQENTPDIELG